MNLHYNPNNDDECDNSISSQYNKNNNSSTQQCHQQYALEQLQPEHRPTIGQQQTVNTAYENKQPGHILPCSIITTLSNVSTTTTTTTLCTEKLLNNTCPKNVKQRHTATKATAAATIGQQQQQQHENNVYRLQKWRQRPRGQQLSVTKNAVTKMFYSQNLCKYFLAMIVVILTSFPSATVMATPQQQLSNSNDMMHQQQQQQHQQQSYVYNETDETATISQIVNTTNNNNNYNKNNINNDKLTNTAVKIILNDYNDAFLQLLNTTEKQQQPKQQQQKQKHQKLKEQKQQQQYLEKIKNHLHEMEPDVSILHADDLLDSFRGTHSLPRQPMYTNEFAVHIPAGKDMADIIADKYGFINMGQVSHEQIRKEKKP